MYNHLINGWNCDPVISIDPYHKQVKEHLYEYFDNWLMENKKTSVVRLTTLAYHFTLDSDENAQDKYRDWLGYTDCISPQALADFEKRFGYSLKSEDFVDQGYYNATYRVPSVQYLDWMQFIQDFVFDYGKTLVNKIHSSGKKAAVFWGDHWIGLEPYSDNYQNYGFDISIGACEDGVALRRLSDCPADHTKEARLYPYFFPDVFNEKGDPITESIRNWVKIRRAMLRVPIDRIGYGGYLGLAYNYPGFIEHVQYIRNQFSDILENTQKTKPFTQPIKVAVLSVWGKLRSWINTVGPDQKFHIGRADINEITGPNMLECLSGLPVDVSFISFADIEENGVSEDVDIIINEGAAGTAWSGGDHWKSIKVQSEIRRWIANGGGLLGIAEPCAVHNGGSFIQLKDVLGVEKETGNTINCSIGKANRIERHFITENSDAKPDFSTKSYIYPISCETHVLKTDDHGHVCLAVNEYDKGRGAYISGISYSLDNADLLYRTLLWLSRNEMNLKKWYCGNVNIGCTAFPKKSRFVVFNNASDIQKGIIYDGSGEVIKIQLQPYEMKWLDIS
jgi:1,3-beta-galactosyl-N-acetylhexosamine phosphorylase